MTVRYGTTPRGFLTAEFLYDDGLPKLCVKESSATHGGDSPAGCLRWPNGHPLPGSSYLWLQAPADGSMTSMMLSRAEAADLVAVLSRWLAEGRLHGEGGGS